MNSCADPLLFGVKTVRKMLWQRNRFTGEVILLFVNSLVHSTLTAEAGASENLLLNGDFEKVNSGRPPGWVIWNKKAVTSTPDAHSGRYALAVQNLYAARTVAAQRITLKPETLYRFSCWVKADGIPQSAKGAHMYVMNADATPSAATSTDLHDTKGQWQYLEFFGKTIRRQGIAAFVVGLGSDERGAEGKASFDDCKAEEVSTVPSGVEPLSMGKESKEHSGGFYVAQTFLYPLIFLISYVIIFLVSGSRKDFSQERPEMKIRIYFLLLLACFCARLFVAGNTAGHGDIGAFKMWSNLSVSNGLSNVYTSGAGVNYPPGYIYVLYLLGKVRQVFGLNESGKAFLILIKLPSIVADGIVSLVLFKTARERIGSAGASMISLSYMFNPAIIINSTVWGQVDSVLALFVFLTIVCLAGNKLKTAAILFTLALLIKPQALIFTPLLLLALIERRDAGLLFKAGLLSLTTFVLLVLPFSFIQAPLWLVNMLRDVIGAFPLASVNAANLFGLFGGNLLSDSVDLVFFPYKTWGHLFIVSTVVFSAWLFFRDKTPSKFFHIGAVIIISVFVCSTSMHDRYLLPALILLAMSYVHTGERKFLHLYVGFSLTYFVNVGYSLFFWLHGLWIPPFDPVLIFTAASNVLLFIFTLWTSVARASYRTGRAGATLGLQS